MVKKSFIHFVMIPLTGVGLYGGFRGQEWYKYRIEIFKNYTLKSLLNQTEKDFALWITVREQERNNPFTIQLERYLWSQKISFIMTFDGLMYWDDKFTKGIVSTFMNCGRVVRGCWRNKTWNDLLPSIRELLFYNKNDTLKERLEYSLDFVDHFYGMKTDWVYLTRLDSDDMLYKDAIKEIQSRLPFQGVYAMRNGYVYDLHTKKLAAWNPPTIPPFYTIIFPFDVFWDAKKHLAYYGLFKSHEDIPNVFKIEKLSDNLYCVLIHSRKNQISTIWDHPFRGWEIDNPVYKKSVLRNFGI